MKLQGREVLGYVAQQRFFHSWTIWDGLWGSGVARTIVVDERDHSYMRDDRYFVGVGIINVELSRVGWE